MKYGPSLGRIPREDSQSPPNVVVRMPDSGVLRRDGIR